MACGTRGCRLAMLFSAFVCFGLAGEAAGQTPGPAPNTTSTAPDFATLVKKGDQARIAGKWSDALHAYAGALELRDDPLVAGRLGLVLLEFREYQAAAGKLFFAVEHGAGLGDAERTRFFQAYVVAKNHVCRLEVVIVQNGAKFEVDGEARLEGRHDFWTFVKPGNHTVRASLEGFEAQTMEIDAPKGGVLAIKIDLRPVKPKEGAAKQPDAEPPPKTPNTPPPECKPAALIVVDTPPARTNSPRDNGSFAVGLGLGFVFEATPTPAVGPHAFVAWRSRSWWEVGVDARVAWTFVEDERSPTTQFVTWSVGITPCGRVRNQWFGCALVQVDGTSDTSNPRPALLPALGLRGGYEFVLRDRFGLQVLGEIVVRPGVFSVLRASSTWESSLVGGAAGVRGVYRF